MGTNEEIAKMLEGIARLLEVEGVDWEPRSYRIAASNIREAEKVETIFGGEGWEGLLKIPGVGSSMANHIIEYIETGKINKFERLKMKYPKEFLKFEKKELANCGGNTCRKENI